MIQLAIVTNRDGAEDLVDILTRESDGNYYTFNYPYRPYKEDPGRSVRPEYVRTIPFKRRYLLMASFFVKRFPNWVTY